MADSFGLKIGLEGEKEFKKALADINQSFKVLGSEMKLATSQFDKNDKSVEALAARNKVLRKESTSRQQKLTPYARLCRMPPPLSGRMTVAPRTGRSNSTMPKPRSTI